MYRHDGVRVTDHREQLFAVPLDRSDWSWATGSHPTQKWAGRPRWDRPASRAVLEAGPLGGSGTRGHSTDRQQPTTSCLQSPVPGRTGRYGPARNGTPQLDRRRRAPRCFSLLRPDAPRPTAWIRPEPRWPCCCAHPFPFPPSFASQAQPKAGPRSRPAKPPRRDEDRRVAALTEVPEAYDRPGGG